MPIDLKNMKTINCQIDGAIVRLSLNRPDAANAINSVLENELYEALKACDADNSVKCVVLTADGPNFSGGHDIQELATDVVEEREPATIEGKNWVRTGELLEPWWFTKLLIVAVKGYVGPHVNTLLLAADFVIAAENTHFSWAEMRVGIGTPFGSYTLMPFHFPMRVAKQLWITGGWMDAETALRLFYVNRVVPVGEEEALAMRYAEQFSRMELENITGNKRGIHKLYEAAGLPAMVAMGREPYVHEGAAGEAVMEHFRMIYDKGAAAAAKSRDNDWEYELGKI
ncbi:MAG: enoyl-CoA hydratase/isomerase family protein [Novosphingobium sp.]|nr:enoyl-CoA hydratase/isomerase family protein [Novosphingobium sp.]